jgi:ATP-dependent Lon protease
MTSKTARKAATGYFLRRQMDAIRKELGEPTARLRTIPREDCERGHAGTVRQQAERELDRFERMGDSNA